MRALGIIVALALCLTLPARASAANGDQVTRLSLPASCISTPYGLGFDGKVLYYTIRDDLAPGTVYMVEAATGQDRGSFRVKKGGNPLTGQLAGLDYDTNRQVIWISGSKSPSDEVYCVSPQTGDVRFYFTSPQAQGIKAIAYDPVQDIILESDYTHSTNTWFANGLIKGGGSNGYNDKGLAFDGVNVWHFTPDWVPPPAPSSRGFLFPSDHVGTIDYTRLFQPGGVNYNDLAYDCVTFSVPVIWVSYNFGCELIAYEVTTNAPCLGPPTTRLLRVDLPDSPRPPLASKLPLTSATTTRAWRVERPISFRDDGDKILTYPTFSLSFYRALGVNDAPQGNLLRLIKDARGNAVVVKE